LEDRFVLSNLAVESGAKAAIFPFDRETELYLMGCASERGTIVDSDGGAHFEREITIDLSALTPRVSIPHSPNDVVELTDVTDTRIDMVFVGTCTGGRVADFHQALGEIERRGGRIAPGVQLVITPASREVYVRLIADGTIARLATLGAVITTPGCG